MLQPDIHDRQSHTIIKETGSISLAQGEGPIECAVLDVWSTDPIFVVARVYGGREARYLLAPVNLTATKMWSPHI